MFRQNLFKAKLIENDMTTRDMAGIIGCNEATLYRKMNGVSDFTRNEIQLIKQALNLSSAEVEDIFFA
ncbi:helix-turn-helix domain-containing protein [Gemmiger sp.]|uniref:helix-turn-helix domain-containing protein n=1 Tax=Gemmiger sp. TaxID=2049027 RepID=UPI0039C5DD78